METYDKKFLGVCAWIAMKLNIDVSWVRIGFVIATVVGFGTPILVYLVIFVLLRLELIN